MQGKAEPGEGETPVQMVGPHDSSHVEALGPLLHESVCSGLLFFGIARSIANQGPTWHHPSHLPIQIRSLLQETVQSPPLSGSYASSSKFPQRLLSVP